MPGNDGRRNTEETALAGDVEIAPGNLGSSHDGAAVRVL
jgi:hypothetical protein